MHSFVSVLVILGALLLPLGHASLASTIATPTAAQARYQDTDFIALIHFNMGTYAHNGDPCCDASNWNVHASYAAGKTSDPATFDPVKLNTTQWMESITGLGANIAILTAKHGCGFTLWPTRSTLPDGAPYGYNVGMSGNASFLGLPRRRHIKRFPKVLPALSTAFLHFSSLTSFAQTSP